MHDSVRIQALLQEAATSTDGMRAQACQREALRLISQMNRSGGGSITQDVGHNQIQMDQIHPPDSCDFIQPLMAPSRWLVLGERPVVGPGTDSAGIRMEFSAGGGWLIGFRGTVTDSTAGSESADEFVQASMGVSMFLNDGEELITNGQATTFSSFADLFAPAVQWSPIMRRVDVKDILTVNFRNFQPAGTGHSLTPSLTFAFWRERYPGMR